MKVFVAGATGVLGRRVVSRLVAAEHEVTGLARSEHGAAVVRQLAATPVRVDLFDRDGLRRAVEGHDVVFNLATAIPSGEQASVRSGWEVNHRIRRDGSRNLVDAALEGGAGRYVQESIALLYADGGERLLDESAPLDTTWITATALDAEAQAARFAAHGGVGIAQRFGLFYGWDSTHTVSAIAAAQAGAVPVLGPDTAFLSSVTTDDAASAVLAALVAPSGIYNVVDDRPLRRREYVSALNDALGAGLRERPVETFEVPSDLRMMLRSLRVTNERFRAVTGWRPHHPSGWQGWPVVIGEWRNHPLTNAG